MDFPIGTLNLPLNAFSSDEDAKDPKEHNYSSSLAIVHSFCNELHVVLDWFSCHFVFFVSSNEIIKAPLPVDPESPRR
jgi:hypothetical protein